MLISLKLTMPLKELANALLSFHKPSSAFGSSYATTLHQQAVAKFSIVHIGACGPHE
jgi:hypothetical protein